MKYKEILPLIMILGALMGGFMFMKGSMMISETTGLVFNGLFIFFICYHGLGVIDRIEREEQKKENNNI